MDSMIMQAILDQLDATPGDLASWLGINQDNANQMRLGKRPITNPVAHCLRLAVLMDEIISNDWDAERIREEIDKHRLRGTKRNRMTSL